MDKVSKKQVGYLKRHLQFPTLNLSNGANRYLYSVQVSPYINFLSMICLEKSSWAKGLCIIVLCSLQFSCAKKSVPPPTIKSDAQKLSRTWNQQGLFLSNSPDHASFVSKPINPANPAAAITFKSDGTYTSGSDAGTWILNGTTLSIHSTVYNASLTITVTITDTNLTLWYPAGSYDYNNADGSVTTFAYMETTFQ